MLLCYTKAKETPAALKDTRRKKSLYKRRETESERQAGGWWRDSALSSLSLYFISESVAHSQSRSPSVYIYLSPSQ